jgi:hypothetical protein
MYAADEISHDKGFDENMEIWGLGDMDCRLFNDNMWKEWKIKVNEDKIKENVDKIKENEDKIKQNNCKLLWHFGDLEFWSTDDDDEEGDIGDFENMVDTYLDGIKTVETSDDDGVNSLCVNVGTLEELWEDDDETVDEETNAKYENIIDEYLSGVSTVCCWD